MPEDKIIKSGQITLPRILFLALCGAVLVVIVAEGYLKVGYLLLTAVLCVLLGLIAFDYGVAMDKVDLAAAQQSPTAPPVTGIPASTDSRAVAASAGRAAASAGDSAVRAKKKSARPAKRRR